ncbi:MAG: 5'-methylthioadenosine/S-adenosylhomocysteine nucleosidase [Gammaproteobacteria bacterium]|nr:MAG: 5'-methylthioadenosine/S-adenosylhomocysteine nucleosidase [Gammaproteobacteria bacterium]
MPNLTQPVAIIGAMPQEVAILTDKLTNAKTTEVAEVKIHSGKINSVPVVVLQSGIGKVNATIATALVIERFAPKAVINTGSAGGVGKDLAVGDIVVGTAVAHHDVDVTAFGYKHGQMAGMPAQYESDVALVSIMQRASKAFANANIHQGQIISGDQFIASSEKFDTIKQHFPQAQAVEMEAAAIAQTCYRFGVPFVVVRAISDLANEQASVSFDAFIEQAGKHSAQMVISAISEL